MRGKIPAAEIIDMAAGSEGESLRCVTLHVGGAPVEYFGIAVNAGSRDDSPETPGLAHFVEHTIFKGTKRRTAWHIINRMEAVGGELNAYTTKETTTVYSIFPSGNLGRAAELVADLALNSQFPAAQLEKERTVVAEEIDSYLDTPSEAIYDDFDDMLFADSALGHNILGSRKSLERIDSAACRRYLEEYFTLDNMVAFYCGPLKCERAAAKIGKVFAGMRPTASRCRRTAPAPVRPFSREADMGIHQAHCLMGTRVCDMYDDERFALSLMINMLGGPGMNSLLNVALRERRGLVYTVEATMSNLTDTGVMSVYFGCDRQEVELCRRLVAETIDSLAQGPLSGVRFNRVLRQYVGQMLVGMDNRESAILGMGRSALYRGRVTPLSEAIERVRGLSPEDVMESARRVINSGLSTLTYF